MAPKLGQAKVPPRVTVGQLFVIEPQQTPVVTQKPSRGALSTAALLRTHPIRRADFPSSHDLFDQMSVNVRQAVVATLKTVVSFL